MVERCMVIRAACTSWAVELVSHRQLPASQRPDEPRGVRRVRLTGNDLDSRVALSHSGLQGAAERQQKEHTLATDPASRATNQS